MALSSVKIKMQNLKEEFESANNRLADKCRELEQEKVTRQEKEKELLAKLCQLQRVESSLDEIHVQLQNGESQLLQLSTVTDEYTRMQRASQCRQNAVEGRKLELESALAQSQSEILVAGDKYEKVATKLLVSERVLGEAEDRASDAERKLKSLEMELHVLTSSLKSLAVHESKACQKSSIYETTVSSLSEKINQVEEENKRTEVKVINLQKQVDNLEEELTKAREDNRKLKEEFEAAYQELHNI